ncbi:hypothetical protein SAMN05216249_101240, partial [Acetitomaculum ruminis DSM 5522]
MKSGKKNKTNNIILGGKIMKRNSIKK